MAVKPLPTIQQLRQLLSYDPETGGLFWNPRTAEMYDDLRNLEHFNRSFAGKCAGGGAHHGYVLVGLSYQGIKWRLWAHRVAWALHYGEWPDGVVDHINGISNDNRIKNLRCVTHAQNMRNRPGNSNSSSLYCGVSWDQRSSRWEACIRVPNPLGRGRGKKLFLGMHANEIDAARAYNVAAVQYHGEFARLNKV